MRAEIERLTKNEQATLKTIDTIQAIRMADEAEIERLTDEYSALVNEVNEASELRNEGRSVEERNAKLLAANMRLTAKVSDIKYQVRQFSRAADLTKAQRKRLMEIAVSGRQCPHTPEVLEKGGMTCPDCGFYVEPYTIDDSSQESKST